MKTTTVASGNETGFKGFKSLKSSECFSGPASRFWLKQKRSYEASKDHHPSLFLTMDYFSMSGIRRSRNKVVYLHCGLAGSRFRMEVMSEAKQTWTWNWLSKFPENSQVSLALGLYVRLSGMFLFSSGFLYVSLCLSENIHVWAYVNCPPMVWLLPACLIRPLLLFCLLSFGLFVLFSPHVHHEIEHSLTKWKQRGRGCSLGT